MLKKTIRAGIPRG